MKDVSLRLESLKLSSSEERIKLRVTSSATLRPQDEGFRRVRSDELVDLMESGKVCIIRGPSCQLDFGFVFKKLLPIRADQNALVKELGRFVLEAPWWAQLPVSPSLKSPAPGSLDVEPEFSIKIHDTLPNLHSNGYPDTQVSPVADLHVPECVPVIRLLKIKFCFTFEAIQERPLPILTREVATDDDMLFEDACESDLDPFEDIMDLEAFESSTPRHDTSFDASSLLKEMPSADSSFFEDHHSTYAHDNMLLYQTDHNIAPLVTPEASVAFKSQQDSSMLDSTEPHFLDNFSTEPLLNLATAKQLTDVALRTLLGGRQTKHTPNIKLGKPRPTRPLSSIMPLLWSPGFKNAMSERSTFLNTISTTLSSLSKTSQLPSLQKKLATIHENGPTQSSAKTHPPRLNQTVQAHVFHMMQTSLYEPIASRRLRPSVIEESGEGEARSGPPSRDYENSGPPQVDLGNASDDVVDVDEDFEDLFGEELLSDGEMDMLFDLEIQRNKERGGEGGSCSMLFGSEGGGSSMLMGGEEVHADGTGETGGEDNIFSTGEIDRDDGDEHILHEREFWSSSIVEEDAGMIMDAEPDTVHGYSSIYLDDPYINNEAILI
ncbi:hypothetical protein VE03_08960 [Pseudogymnoascus sp. 23342-1-I1]|nr:hypothetical protein VE03_08960 [Pseudogymnoascus sp. 23342-1-I1]